jgi:hypothetical protein
MMPWGVALWITGFLMGAAPEIGEMQRVER